VSGFGGSFLQHPTHAELIATALPSSSQASANGGPDAIIVPAARSADNLKSAISLAADCGSQLVLLCSHEADPFKALRLVEESKLSPGRATVVGLPSAYRHDLFRFESSRWIRNAPGYQTRSARDHDLSVKRNIGLALARMIGWRRIFFMDDDIRRISADALGALTGLLGANGPGGPYRTAGMTVTEFPDNSVVCHARRDVKTEQDVFVSGSVLAVDTTADFGFFPDIYNEDWLFFYDDAAAKRLASPGFHAEQEAYDPFEDPKRASREEFGDIVAEGIYSLLHDGRGLEAATRDYWGEFLDDRKRIIDEVANRLHLVVPDGDLRDEMTLAIAAAERTWRTIHPGMCVRYIGAWREDLERWGTRRNKIPQMGSLADALRELGLDPPLILISVLTRHALHRRWVLRHRDRRIPR
jgi:hypothetical protein